MILVPVWPFLRQVVGLTSRGTRPLTSLTASPCAIGCLLDPAATSGRRLCGPGLRRRRGPSTVIHGRLTATSEGAHSPTTDIGEHVQSHRQLTPQDQTRHSGPGCLVGWRDARYRYRGHAPFERDRSYRPVGIGPNPYRAERTASGVIPNLVTNPSRSNEEALSADRLGRPTVAGLTPTGPPREPELSAGAQVACRPFSTLLATLDACRRPRR